MNMKSLRILGKGLTAQAVHKRFPNSTLYDESDFDTLYDVNSNEPTIVSPGIPPFNKMVQNAKNMMSDYDLFAQQMPFSIWISGTNGKTTTTQMIQHLLQQRGSLCGGNIGTPVCELDTNANIWILETSSFTLHYTNKAKPNLYVLLPISEDHISWHGSFEEYQKAKLKPLDFMQEGEIAILPEAFKDYPTKACKIVYKNSDDLCAEFDIDKSKVNFKEPFLLDALLALGCQKIVFDEVDYRLMNSFKVDKHKVEEFEDIHNRLWIDDSKATNVDATINALNAYSKQTIHLILGGDDKGAKLEPLFEYLQSLNVYVYIMGSNYERLIHFCTAYKITYNYSKNLENCVHDIALKHDMNSVAILSPAAASLDQYSSYKQRGEQFKLFVNNLSLN